MNFDSFFDDFFSPRMSDFEKTRRLQDLQRDLGDVKRRLRDTNREGTSARTDLRDELEVLQCNFARTLLLLHGLTTTLLRKQVISRDELQAVLSEIDLLDGKADGVLDSAAAPACNRGLPIATQPNPPSTTCA